MKKLTITFWALVGTFLVIISEFFIPSVRELFRGSIFFLLPFIVFSLLGIILIVLILREKIEGVLKKFLILTGVSAGGFFVSIFLHNAFYALGVITNQIIILNYLVEVINVGFFIIAIFVCPLGFLIGVIGSIVLLNKKKNK